MFQSSPHLSMRWNLLAWWIWSRRKSFNPHRTFRCGGTLSMCPPQRGGRFQSSPHLSMRWNTAGCGGGRCRRVSILTAPFDAVERSEGEINGSRMEFQSSPHLSMRWNMGLWDDTRQYVVSILTAPFDAVEPVLGIIDGLSQVSILTAPFDAVEPGINWESHGRQFQSSPHLSMRWNGLQNPVV